MLNQLGKIAKPYGDKCLLVTTEDVFPLNQLFEKVKALLNQSGIEVYHFDQVIPNPTVEIIESGIETLIECKVDFVLAVGGGSSIDTAKTIALLNESERNWNELFNKYNDPFGQYESLCDMPLLSIPTTAGTGSEVTQAAVITMGHEKNTIFHPSNYSNEAILDPELLLTLPSRLTAATGFDAFCHAFESFISQKASPLSEMYSFDAMKKVVEVLPKAIKSPENLSYREDLMFAQMQAGIALANSGASAPHPLSEIIGGIAHVSHGEALALVFPEFVEVFYNDNKKKFDQVSELFNKPLNEGIIDFLKEIDLYNTKATYGISKEQEELLINSPILGYLPFGSKETLQSILIESFNR